MAEMYENNEGGAPFDPLQEAMGRIEVAEVLEAKDLDLSNLGLGPHLSANWDGWQTLGRLDSLRRLKLDQNQIIAIPIEGWEALGRLVALSSLDLQKNEITTIPAEGWQALERLVDLRTLNLKGNGMTPLPEAGWETLKRRPSLSICTSGTTISAISLLRAGKYWDN
jgi:Leucine-rich repeat (LRR) protein